MLFPLLLACHGLAIGLAESPDPDAGPGDPPLDTAADTGPDTGPDMGEPSGPPVTEEAAPAFDDSDLAAWVFTLDRIHTVDITLSAAARADLEAAPYVYTTAAVAIDGEAVDDVGLRLRGKIGSFRSLSAKPKFKIKFDANRDGQRFYGMEELSLNNSVVDCSYMKEVIGWRLYEAAGVPHLRTSYGRVRVNGVDYGLYLLVETPDDTWLGRHYADPGGNLYDGKYAWYGGYNYTLLDFGNGVDALYQLEEGTDVGNADIAGISSVLLATGGTPAYNDAMGEVLDWDAFHRMTAVDQFIGHNDGYSMNTNNYRVYFDPSDGRADLLPWDLDYTFLHDYDWGLSWSSPNGNLTAACWQDPVCAAAQRDAVAAVLEAASSINWPTFLTEIESLTYDDTQDDPRRECAAADVQPTRDALRAWMGLKPSELRAWWGL